MSDVTIAFSKQTSSNLETLYQIEATLAETYSTTRPSTIHNAADMLYEAYIDVPGALDNALTVSCSASIQMTY